MKDMQRLRLKLVSDLAEVFELSKQHALSNHPDVTAKQKQIWVRIMSYTAQVINSISKSCDEAEVTKDLERLEAMVNEALAYEKARRDQRERPEPASSAAARGP
jgi:hypothetical protein